MILSIARLFRRRVAADRRGTTALEFGLICGPLVGFIVGLVCLSLQFLTTAVLDQVVLEAARQMQLGTLAAGTTGNGDGNLRSFVCNRMGGLAVSCTAQLKIYVNSAASVSSMYPVPAAMPATFNPGIYNAAPPYTPYTVVQVSCVSPFSVWLISLPGLAITSTAVYRSYQ